jgi:hypothetical protein
MFTHELEGRNGLQLMLIEMPGTVRMIDHDKVLENVTIGPIYVNKNVIGEVKNLYYNNKRAYFQNMELSKNYWNNHYATNVIELITNLARKKECTHLILEQLQTEELGMKYLGNKSKFEKICKRLKEESKAVKNYVFELNNRTGCYDIILEL